MRKMAFLGLVALTMGLLSTACVDPVTEVPVIEEQTTVDNLFTFTASFDEEETKTSLSAPDPGNPGGPRSVLWKAGDQIKIYNTATPAGKVYTLSDGAGTKTASFTGDPLDGTGPFFAVYPASVADTSRIYDNTIAFTVPAVQQYAANSFGDDANIAWAKAATSEDKLNFQIAGGLLKLTLQGSQTITKINLYTRGSEKFNGKLIIGSLTTTPTLTYEEMAGQDGGTLTLDCSPGVDLSLSPSTDFYFVLPPDVLTSGFQVEILDAEKGMLKNAPANPQNVIERKGVLAMPEFSYTQQYNIGFLAAADAGIWTGVKQGQDLTPIIEIPKQPLDGGQYAIISGAVNHSFRFQNMSSGYAVSLTAANDDLVVGGAPTLAIASVGTTAPDASVTGTVTVIKKAAGRIWLEDAAGKGFIIR